MEWTANDDTAELQTLTAGVQYLELLAMCFELRNLMVR